MSFYSNWLAIRGRDNAARRCGATATRPYKSGPCKSWIKVRNPESPAYLRIIDVTFSTPV